MMNVIVLSIIVTIALVVIAGVECDTLDLINKIFDNDDNQ